MDEIIVVPGKTKKTFLHKTIGDMLIIFRFKFREMTS